MSGDDGLLRLGFFLLAMGMSVVFLSLVLLMIAIKLIRRFGGPRPVTPAATLQVTPEVSGVLMAAIATTLLLDAEQADEEERLVLTLRALQKPYSVWWQSRLARAYWSPQNAVPPRAEVWRAPDPGRNEP
ncbi:MAG TPA: OadG family protein [Longimicrobiales bacterium]|nr:OadG family protein [Longimicrobiales bacterium]